MILSERTKNILIIFMAIIVGIVLMFSLYFTSLYFKSIKNTKNTPPKEVQDFINAPRQNFIGTIIKIEGDNVKVKRQSDQTELDLIIGGNTVFTKITFGKNNSENAKRDELKINSEASFMLYQDIKSNNWTSEAIEIINK